MSKHIFWISSYPKSGNTLFRAIISSLFFSEDGLFDLSMLKHTSQFEMRRRLDIIKNKNNSDFLKVGDLKILSKYWQFLQSKENLKIKNGFGFIKSHSCLISMFNNWFTTEELTAGFVYIVRDPRDVAISWSKHSGLSIDDSIDFMLSYKSCIEWAKTKSELPEDILPKSYLGSWSDHVLSWTENKLNVPRLIFKYEDLVYKKEESLRKIINFFEESYSIKFKNAEKKISNIIKSTDFKNLRLIEQKHGFQEANLGNFFRKGEKNQWKSTLNSLQIKKIENKFRDFMNKFSYE
jgi:hypothetical protein